MLKPVSLQMCLYFLIPISLDTLRVFVGPLPRLLCKTSVLVKNIVTLNVSQISLLMTVSKFFFLCYYKSIPLMDDNFLSTFCYMIINLISILATTARFYLPGKPTLNELICTGCFYEQWIEEPKLPSTHVLIHVVCFLSHLILSIPITLAKIRMRQTEPQMTGVTFGSYLTSWILLSCMLSAVITFSMINSIHPRLLNQFPFVLLTYCNQIGIQLIVATTLCISFIVKSKRLRKFLIGR